MHLHREWAGSCGIQESPGEEGRTTHRTHVKRGIVSTRWVWTCMELSTAAAAENRGGLRRYDTGRQRHLLHTSCRKNLATLLLLKEQTRHNCHHCFLVFLLQYGSNNYMFKACGISSVIQMLGTSVHISLTGLRSWAGMTLTSVCLLLLIAPITMLTFL